MKGFFVIYRGNGYGSYDTIDEARDCCKNRIEPPHMAFIYYGTAEVRDGIISNESLTLKEICRE